MQPGRLRDAVRPGNVGYAAIFGLRGGVRAAEAHPLRAVPLRVEGVDVSGLRRLGG